MNPLAVGLVPVFLGWSLIKGVGRTFSGQSVAGLTLAKSLFQATTNMKNQQEIVIQRQLDAGQLEIVVPYDDNTLDKLFAISIIPEVAFIIQQTKDPLKRTQFIESLKLIYNGLAGGQINPSARAKGIANLDLLYQLQNTFDIDSDLWRVQSVVDYNEPYSLSRAIDNLDLIVANAERMPDKVELSAFTSLAEQSALYDEVLELDDLYDLLGEENFVKAKQKNGLPYLFGLTKTATAFGELENEMLLMTDVPTYGADAIGVGYEPVYYAKTKDGRYIYATIIENTDNYTITLIDKPRTVPPSRKEILSLGLEAVDTSSMIIQSEGFEQLGKVSYGVKPVQGLAKSAGVLLGRALWIDTAILLGSAGLSLFIPQVDPFSPIGEGIEAIFRFVGRTLDLNPEELAPEIENINLDAGIFTIASQLFALDNIQVGFTPTAETIVRDLNLDGRTFGVALTNAGIDASFNSFRAYDSWDVLTILAITVIVVGLLRQVPAFFKS